MRHVTVRNAHEKAGPGVHRPPEIVWPPRAEDGSLPWPANDVDARAAGLTKLVRASDEHVVYAMHAKAREIAEHPESGYAIEPWPAE